MSSSCEASKINDIFNKWSKSLTSNNLSSFKSLTNNTERVKFILAYHENNPVELFLDTVGKNNTTSETNRKYGNKLYAAAKYEEALKYYTKSIAFSSHQSQEQTLALGNRAACLLNLGYIADAIVDLQRALQIPNIDPEYEEKLQRRQEVCMNRIIECKEPVTCKQLPVISSSNEYFDSASNKITVATNDQVGRHLVATGQILTGEVLVIEKPYCSVLLPESFYTHCSCCLLRVPSFIECPSCATTLYCSTECLNKHKEKHNYECHIVERLVLLGIRWKIDFLALRILIEALIDGQINLQSGTYSTKEVNNDRYESLDFRRVFDLVGNTEKRSETDLLKRAFTAGIMVVTLQKCTTFFKDFNIEPSVAGGVILHFLQSLPCNAHEVTDVVNGETEEIGAAAYSTLSLINHACEPNVVRHSNGSSVVLRAIRPIQERDEILDNYGYHYATHELQERKPALMRQYFFECQCDACAKYWPLYPDIPSENPVLKSSLTPEYLAKTKEFEDNFQLVLAKKCSREIINSLCCYLDFVDGIVTRPWQNINKCQEAIKFGLNFIHDFNRLT